MHTRVLAPSTSETVSKHCRMTNENLWIEHVFKGRFLNKSFTENIYQKIKGKLKRRQKKMMEKIQHGLSRRDRHEMKTPLLCCFRWD